MIRQRLSDRGHGSDSNKGSASVCEPQLRQWYLDLEREEVLDRRKKDAVHSTRRSS